MTEQRDEQAGAPAEPGLEVSPELIKDLDVTGDDAENIAAGWARTAWPSAAVK